MGATSAINSLNPPSDSFSSTQIEQQVASGEGRMSTSQNVDSVEELKQVSPMRRRQVCFYCLTRASFSFSQLANLSFWDASRKRIANKSESDGCKLCNCKRSKCLKL